MDINGKAGADLFKQINSPDQVQARSHARPTNTDPNTRLDILITDTAQLSTSDYEVLFSSATEFTVRRVSDDKVSGPYVIGSDPAPELDGFSIAINAEGSNQLGAGDRFLLTPTRSAAGAMESVMKQPEELGFAAPAKVDASLENRGNAKVTQPTLIDGPQPIDPTAMQAFLPITFAYDEASSEMILSSGAGPVTPATIPVVPGQSNQLEYSIEGYTFSMTMTGTALNEDSFVVAINEGKSDNRNALILSNLQTDAVLGQANGAAGYSFAEGYGDLVQRVATFTAQARSDSEASGAVLKQVQNNRDSVSAVNLDEEAANLIKFEQYYNASAQVIQIARSVFDTLLNSIR